MDNTADLLPLVIRHYRSYGIVPPQRVEDWSRYLARAIGDRKFGQYVKLTSPLASRKGTDQQYRNLYDYVAAPTVYPAVCSLEADTLIRTAVAVGDAVKGRRKIAEIGCHVGFLATLLAQLDPERQVVGVDVNPSLLQQATRVATNLSLGDRTSFVQVNLNASVPSGPFDAIVEIATLQYVEGRADALARMKKQLSDDGILVSVPQLGTSTTITDHMRTLKFAGYRLHTFGFVYSVDLGKPKARPFIVVAKVGEPISVNVEECVREALDKLQSGAIEAIPNSLLDIA